MAKISKTTVTISAECGRAMTDLTRHAVAVKAKLAKSLGEQGADDAIKFALSQKDQYLAETIRVADGMQIMRVAARPEVMKKFREDCEKYAEMSEEEVLKLCLGGVRYAKGMHQ